MKIKSKLLSSLVCLFMVGDLVHAASEPPNIVLIMADDLGWGDTGYNGHPNLKTSNLDAMARNGLRFDRFYAAAPVCSPTRGSCLTGRHPSRYGVFGANSGHLLKEEVNLADVVREHGYSTGHFGKWHLGTLTTNIKDSNRGRPGRTEHYAPPWSRGFDVSFSTEAKTPTFWEPGDYDRYGTYYWTGPEERVSGDQIVGDDSKLIMDRAIPSIEEAVRNEKPFFSVIWFHAPHKPVIGAPEYLSMYPDQPENKRHYYAVVTALDAQVGRLRQTLRELGVAGNTMVWFCSDNGPEGNPGPSGRAQGSAGPFRGRKRSLYEGGVRVPGILEWPARIEKGRSTDVTAVTSDFLPTIFDVLDRDIPDDRPLDGISLLPVIEGSMKRRPEPIAFESHGYATLNSHRYKLVHNRRGKRHRADNGEVQIAEWELYDLLRDRGETRNIAEEHPNVVERMQTQLKDWQASCRASRQRFEAGLD